METVRIEKDTLCFLEQALEEKVMEEDEVVTFGVDFGNGMEMDITVVGCQDEPAYAEAVLFQNGYEVACSEVEDEILGIWELEHNGRTYAAKVVEK